MEWVLARHRLAGWGLALVVGGEEVVVLVVALALAHLDLVCHPDPRVVEVELG